MWTSAYAVPSKDARALMCRMQFAVISEAPQTESGIKTQSGASRAIRFCWPKSTSMEWPFGESWLVNCYGAWWRAGTGEVFITWAASFRVSFQGLKGNDILL